MGNSPYNTAHIYTHAQDTYRGIMCRYCIKQCTVVSKTKQNKKNLERRKGNENISHKIIVVSSSDVNHRIYKSGVFKPSSDAIERGSGDAIGARPACNKR